MRSEQFQRFLSDIPLLTKKQRIILDEALTQQDSSNTLEQVIERRFCEHPVCPHCESENIHQWGIRNQRQRYHCKDCNKTFNAFSKTPLARLQHPEKWNRYLESMTQSTTLRPIAKACGITLKTSFNWRHRFLEVLEDDQSDELGEIIELDETFFRESFKGQKKDLPRPARKRGGSKKKDCRKIPVMVARDRSKRTVDGVLETGSADELCHCLNGRISMTAAVCADAHLAHEKLARKLGFIFKELVTSSGEHIKEGIFHLQHVNAYHSTLKGWLAGIFHGVATKYLPHYLGWRRELSAGKKLTLERLCKTITDHWEHQPLMGT